MIALWRGNLKKGWIEIHEINGVIHEQTGFRIKTATVPRQRRQKSFLRLLASPPGLYPRQQRQRAC
jgi:hypothetical protein